MLPLQHDAQVPPRNPGFRDLRVFLPPQMPLPEQTQLTGGVGTVEGDEVSQGSRLHGCYVRH